MAPPKSVPFDVVAFREALLHWYDRFHRKLPWRETRDPYAIWISEVMLQQTRVATVLPYYGRFLEKFPDVEALASATESDLLTSWSGLGYYSRARNLQKAAQQMNGVFPKSYDAIRSLAGIGDYTAAAVASIAFGLPHAALDGNVIRVLARLTNDDSDTSLGTTRRKLHVLANELLDSSTPGRYNQAMMELGATVCTPKQPQCLICPVRGQCSATRAGTHSELPIKAKKLQTVRSVRTLLIVCKNGDYLMWQRSSDAKILAGYWELPEPEHISTTSMSHEVVGEFKHSITNHNYTFHVVKTDVTRKPRGLHWISPDELQVVPLSTTARKALTIAGVLS